MTFVFPFVKLLFDNTGGSIILRARYDCNCRENKCKALVANFVQLTVTSIPTEYVMG